MANNGGYLTQSAAYNAHLNDALQRQALQQQMMTEQDKAAQEKKIKRQKDMMDFYRTVRDYLSPSKAFEAAQKQYPELPEELANASEDKGNVDIQSKMLDVYGKQQDIQNKKKREPLELQKLQAETEKDKAEAIKAGKDKSLTPMQDVRLQGIKAKALDSIKKNSMTRADPGVMGMGGKASERRDESDIRSLVENDLGSDASYVSWDDPDIKAALKGQATPSTPADKPAVQGSGMIVGNGKTSYYGQPSGDVKVQAPDGSVGTIPAANLQKALAKGYKQVQ